MKGLLGILCLLHSSVRGVLAQTSLAVALAELPSCAVPCLETAIEQSTCSATNTACICTNESLLSKVTLCVAGNCTIPEGLTTKNITETICGAPVRDRSEFFNTISNTFGSLSGAAVALRILSKLVTRTEFGLDDYSIFLALASGIPSSVLEIHGLSSNGLGRDIWTVTPAHITKFLENFYIVEVLYFAQVSLLKLSLLFFYLRIFPGHGFRKLLWGTVVFDVLFGTASIFAGIFQCSPISYYWTQWDGLHKGKCINVNSLGWANAIISIALDIWMLGLALSQLFHLQMHWKKKIGVALMFCVGTFITVVSIIRLTSLVQFANSTNPTWDNLNVTIWSSVEINVGIICTCMPSIRVLLMKTFPKFLGTSRNASTNKYYAHGSNRLGTNVSVGRSNETSTPPKDSKAILYSQSYVVDIDTEDETRLVSMVDLPPWQGDSSSRSQERIQERSIPE